MKRLSLLLLVIFALPAFSACDASKTEQAPAASEQAEAPTEETPPTVEAPVIKVERPATARNLEQRYREEAQEKITPDNVEDIIAELEKEIEAEIAEMGN